VIEEQVDPEVLVADLESDLPSNEREAGTHLQQEPFDVHALQVSRREA
jgi:hypothetical protein